MYKGIRWLMVLGLLFLGAVVPVSAARAGTSCTYPLCSETANRLPSGNYVKVARDWCGNAERLQQNNPPCGAKAVVAFVASGHDTPGNEDWDAFRVEPGCYLKYRVYFTGTGGSWSDRSSDRRGRGTEWIRVHNNEVARIYSRSCS